MREGKVEIPVDDYLDLLKDKKALEENEVKVCEYTAGTACVRTMIHYCTIDDTVQKIDSKIKIIEAIKDNGLFDLK